MDHVEFPIPEKGTPPTSGYIKNFHDGSWKLHGIQRNDTTWKPEEYRKTIQSIFSNILISPFVGSLQADGVTTHLLDGGHRTLAMIKFVNNEFKVCAPSTNTLCLYKELPDVDKKVFDDRRPLHTFVYTNLTKAQEELLFFRLNIGLPLSSGEAVRAFHTIPMCILASELSEEFDWVIQGKIDRAVTHNNERHDTASWILLILQNFHEGKIVLGENPGPSKQAENLKRCERYRDTVINQAVLEEQTSFLMKILKDKRIKKKFPSYVIPTIQCIMLRHPTVTTELISSFLFDMLSDMDSSANPLVKDWLDHGRGKVSNPAKPNHCGSRADIFDLWNV